MVAFVCDICGYDKATSERGLNAHKRVVHAGARSFPTGVTKHPIPLPDDLWKWICVRAAVDERAPQVFVKRILQAVQKRHPNWPLTNGTAAPSASRPASLAAMNDDDD